MKSVKPKDCRTIKPGDLVEYKRDPTFGGEIFYHTGLVIERGQAGFRIPIARIQFTDYFLGYGPVWIDCKDLWIFE